MTNRTGHSRYLHSHPLYGVIIVGTCDGLCGRIHSAINKHRTYVIIYLVGPIEMAETKKMQHRPDRKHMS